MFNKRGQELSIGTLILIVLGIIILVLLILGFSMGWSNLWEKINIFGGGTSLEAVAEKCKLAQSNVGFCQTFMEVNDGGTKKYINCNYRKIREGIDKPMDCSVNVEGDKCQELLFNKFKKQYRTEDLFKSKFEGECKATSFIVNDVECSSAKTAPDAVTTYCVNWALWLEFDTNSNQLKLKSS